MEVDDNELMRSSRGRTVYDFAHDPSSGEANDVKRTAASRAMLAVREKSSMQFTECTAAPPNAMESAPMTNEEGRPTTRTAMLAMRKQQAIESNAIFVPKGSMPIGVQPGAPGRNPDMKKFTADDVHRNIGHPPK